MNTDELNICQHALGLDKCGRGVGSRNHYVAGSDDAAVCRGLVSRGLMREYAASQLSGGDPVFTVTEIGRKAVVDETSPPKLTRSQLRYRSFLHLDLGVSFGEFLKMEGKRKHAVL